MTANRSPSRTRWSSVSRAFGPAGAPVASSTWRRSTSGSWRAVAAAACFLAGPSPLPAEVAFLAAPSAAGLAAALAFGFADRVRAPRLVVGPLPEEVFFGAAALVARLGLAPSPAVL